MLTIALDAGHGPETPGKRCDKRVDPYQTREWILNSRIANKVEYLLQEYRCNVIRVDDERGVEDFSLGRRVRVANNAGAHVYISIHHDAARDLIDGGGITVMTSAQPSNTSTALAKVLYERAIENTGLRGDRADPVYQRGDLYVLNHTTMPAVLVECGFMNSTVDTPIILTEEFADRMARSIVEAIDKVFGLEEIELTKEQVRAIARDEFNRLLAELDEKPASMWAETKLKKAVDAGITDGKRPQAFATRQEVALMVYAGKS